jgi:hypothetical protein
MAKAPTPGRARADEAAQTTLRMTMAGRTLEVQPSALSLEERFVIRSATGLPFEAFFAGGEQSIGEDSIAVLWWCARRANGEPNLAFRQFIAEWVFDADNFDIEVDEDDGEDQSPEG